MTSTPFNLSKLMDVFHRQQDELLFRLNQSGKKSVYIWGAGKNGQMIARILAGTIFTPRGFYDINAERTVLGITVFPEPETLDEEQIIILAMNEPKAVVNHVRNMCETSGAEFLHAINSVTKDAESFHSGHKSLADYAGIHQGKRCFVVGNGPSLNKLDMSLLKDELTIGSNRCFIGFDSWGVKFPYWGVEDMQVGGWQAEGWKKLRGITKFVPQDMLHHVEDNDPDVCPVNLVRIAPSSQKPLFSIYPQVVFYGHTVTYVLLQLAAIMGCSEIYLIGVDFHFTDNGTRKERNGDIWKQQGADLNHFDPGYIPTGRFMSNPHWDRQKLAFESARHAGELHGFKIYNATPDSKLDVFERVDFSTLFKKTI